MTMDENKEVVFINESAKGRAIGSCDKIFKVLQEESYRVTMTLATT
jgi:hypothetical protein